MGRVLSLGAVLILLVILSAPHPAKSATDEELRQLKKQLELMNQQMQAIQKKIEELEKKSASKEEDIEDLDERLSKAELHTATDKVSFSLELRSRADTLHYKDIRIAPDSFLAGFFTPVAQGGFNGATLQQIQAAMGQMSQAGMVPKPDKRDADNDIVFTNKFRLNMKAKFNNYLDFAGRLAAYKVWGDSTGVKFNQGSLGDITLDGNTSSLPHGDIIRLERAYFNYKNRIGRVPINFSLGRRPATEGPPLEYGMYSLEGGSPLATIINWQFDGASLNFGLEDVTGIPGAALKFCYGLGFEGDWGNSFSLNSNPDVDDVHMAGLIATLYDDDTTSVVLNYAHAWDVTDGFTGLTVMPFVIAKRDTNGDGTDEYYFETNDGGYISRVEPSTNIGDWDAASLLLRTNYRDIDFFLAGSWSRTNPSRVSRNPYFEILGQSLLSSNGKLENHSGYSIYAGTIFPIPVLKGRLGFEYNWGSKYWFNFTGAEDSLVGSKLATRGHVFEGYYIQPIFGDHFFLKFGGQYFDYEYTGSGNPLGKPVKISDATAMDSLNAVIDKVWVGYASATVRW